MFCSKCQALEDLNKLWKACSLGEMSNAELQWMTAVQIQISDTNARRQRRVLPGEMAETEKGRGPLGPEGGERKK